MATIPTPAAGAAKGLSDGVKNKLLSRFMSVHHKEDAATTKKNAASSKQCLLAIIMNYLNFQNSYSV